MPLLKDGAVQPDRWTYLAEDEYPAVGQPVIIDYDRWRDGDAAIAAHNGPLGIRLRSDQAPDLIEDDLGRFDVIALEFPVITDGRPFRTPAFCATGSAFRANCAPSAGSWKIRYFS